MPKVTAALIAALALIALTGCAAATDAAPQGTPPPTASETTQPSSESTSEPLAAKTTEPSTDDADTKFLAYVRETLLPETQIPNATDEQLIAAGHDACKQLQSGVALEEVRVVEGESAHPSTGAFYDTSAILSGAILNYCPEFA